MSVAGAKKRVVIWRLLTGILREVHKLHFDGPLGADLDLLMILGAVVASENEGRPTSASKISNYLEMPRETVRRKMVQLEKLGLLKSSGNGKFEAGPKIRSEHLPKIAKMIRAAAAALTR